MAEGILWDWVMYSSHNDAFQKGEGNDFVEISSEWNIFICNDLNNLKPINLIGWDREHFL